MFKRALSSFSLSIFCAVAVALNIFSNISLSLYIWTLGNLIQFHGIWKKVFLFKFLVKFSRSTQLVICGQSFELSTILNYNSWAVATKNDHKVLIYNSITFIRMANMLLNMVDNVSKLLFDMFSCLITAFVVALEIERLPLTPEIFCSNPIVNKLHCNV